MSEQHEAAADMGMSARLYRSEASLVAKPALDPGLGLDFALLLLALARLA